MKKSLLAGVGVLACAATGLGVAQGHATPAPTTPADQGRPTMGIIGGTRAANTPWAVQLHLGDQYRWEQCTGEQISDQWVLTARHCIESGGTMSVYFSNSTTNPGQPVIADRLIAAPKGDIALVHLSKPRPNSSYPALALSYDPGNGGDEGRIMGYGLRANGAQATGLFQAEVDITGSSDDWFGGQGIEVKGWDGASNHGDSGGPLIVDGRVVGVCSWGADDPGANTHGYSTYANLTQATSWIRRTTGL